MFIYSSLFLVLYVKRCVCLLGGGWQQGHEVYPYVCWSPLLAPQAPALSPAGDGETVTAPGMVSGHCLAQGAAGLHIALRPLGLSGGSTLSPVASPMLKGVHHSDAT